MKRLLNIIFVTFGLGFLFAESLIPAKYAGEFLSGTIGARPGGMGGAYSSVVQDATALYWNPAGLIFANRPQIHGMHAERFSGLVNNDFLGAAFSFGENQALGFGMVRVGVDGIPVTRLKNESKTLGDYYADDQNRLIQNVPYVAQTIQDQETAFIFSYSRRHSSLLTWGSSVKLIHKQAGDFSAWGIGFDFGLLVFPYRDLRVGFVLQDGTSTLIAWNGKRKELIVPHIKTGLCYPFQFRRFRLTPALDADIRFENRGETAQMHIGSLSFDWHAGVELEMFRHLHFRTGMDCGHLTLGSGIEFSILSVDYSILPSGDLGNSQRVSATISMDPKWF